MSGAYSKGPWFAELGSDGTFGLYARTPTRGTQLIAEFFDQDMGDHLPAQANLTMAVAAPDLLAALQKARGFVLTSDHASSARVLEQVEAAIAAATGEGL